MTAKKWEVYFKGKRITMMGLGLLGRGIGVARFLAQNGAELTVTDLKTGERLASSLEQLKGYTIKYVLGEHRLEDFENCDLVIKAAGVPLDSPYIAQAKVRGIPVEMDASLFARLKPDGVVLVGITGTRGKSTTTQLIAEILKQAGRRVFLGGNIRGIATLPLLDQVKSGDYVVLELDSWQLQGFGEAKSSPQVAVFTNLMVDHLNYYRGNEEQYFEDKANIFRHQKAGDWLIVGRQIGARIKKERRLGKLVEMDRGDLPQDWRLKIPGEHNRDNAALAMGAGQALGIERETIRKAVENFGGIEGRLQRVGEKGGIEVYNDNNATTPEATAAGLAAVGEKRPVILIMGGADKGLVMEKLLEPVEKYCRVVVLLSGTGTEKVRDQIKAIPNLKVQEGERLEEAVRLAVEAARPGEVILFSPAMASFSKYFENEYERNDLFMREINAWLKTDA